ncbi:hypothetical protein F0562_008658 [Nyssa sinensis]|uniref:Uncharacterized protein n=1 Tax=Nyssa sinensis TaxID=561372 RepID=A0A5J5A891_9ASTE|nr:hypothetical protein F0562_008658 [Nyssa sinensis]
MRTSITVARKLKPIMPRSDPPTTTPARDPKSNIVPETWLRECDPPSVTWISAILILIPVAFEDLQEARARDVFNVGFVLDLTWHVSVHAGPRGRFGSYMTRLGLCWATWRLDSKQFTPPIQFEELHYL